MALQPAVVTGHSLGEFTALVAAGAIDFAACVDLVRFRGKAMQEAVPHGTGAMAALLGLEDAEVEAACAEAAQGSVVEAVNFNSPGQVVIAGEKAAVLRAIEAAKARGAKRAIELPVSVPSHSSLMKSAGVRLGERLAATEIRTPRIRYLSAVDAQRALRIPMTSARCSCASCRARFAGPPTVTALEQRRRHAHRRMRTRAECSRAWSNASRRAATRKIFSLDEPESFQAALAAVAA